MYVEHIRTSSHNENEQVQYVYHCCLCLTDFLMIMLCKGHIRSHPLNEHQEQITLIGEGNPDFTLWMERAWSPLCCYGNVTVGHIMELCNEYQNCTKFQFYTENVFRDIQFFVILHHFVSTM